MLGSIFGELNENYSFSMFANFPSQPSACSGTRCVHQGPSFGLPLPSAAADVASAVEDAVPVAPQQGSKGNPKGNISDKSGKTLKN